MSRAPQKRSARPDEASPHPAPRRTRAKVAPSPEGPLTRLAAVLNDQVTHEASARPAKKLPATRRNKKGLVLYVAPEVSRALRRLSLDTGESVQSLGLRALDLLFAQHGVRVAIEPPSESARRAPCR